MELKVLLVVIVCYCPLISQIKAQCIIESSLSATVRPTFFRNTTIQTSLISQQSELIYLDEKEEIVGHCPTSFKNTRNGYEYSKLTINCNNRQITINDNYGRYYPGRTFECTTSPQISGKCSIISSTDKVVRPKFFKKIGTRTIQISSELQAINMKYNQEMTVRCYTKFKSPNVPSTELNLFCTKDKIVVLGHPYSTSSNSLECESLEWNLYESVTQFPWCPSSMASYILARPRSNSDYEYMAGICYDIEELSLKSLYYAAKPKFVKYSSPALLKSYKPLMAIADIDTNFISKKTYAYNNPQIVEWFKFSNFKIASIVQNSNKYHDLFKQFDQLLNIDWWSGLQLGNWKLYEKALANHIDSVGNEYDILTGISNNVAAPTRNEDCHQNITMVEMVDSENTKLPLYIWNYLKSTRNVSDQVVVIGVNSPFYDFYDEKDIVFCNDICHQFEWLENIHSTFRYRPMGVIFCCSVGEVIASERLEGFGVPKELLPPTSFPPLIRGVIETDTTTVESIDAMGYDETTKRELEYDAYGNHY